MTTAETPRAPARRVGELVLPGFVIGMAAGALIGLLGLIGGLTAGGALVAVLVLGVPLGLFGALYDWLLAAERMKIGTLAPAVLFWLPLFPLARLLNEVLSDVLAGNAVTLPSGVAGFLAYQAIISLGYAIGFVFVHEQVAPMWWLRVQEHNPVVGRLMERYVEHAAALHRMRASRGGRSGRARQSGRR